MLVKLRDRIGLGHAVPAAIPAVHSQADPVDARRSELSAELNRLCNSTVKFGPLKGLRFAADSWYGQIDRASMLFGLYEQEVLHSLTNVPDTHRTFIDLGAADGYYGVGALVNDLFDHSYCFEISAKGQEVIRTHAVLNGVSERVTIYGIAEKDFHKYLPCDQLSKSVLLIDIEGAEFDLFDDDTFRLFKDAVIIVELHDFVFPDGAERLQRFLASADRYFTTTMLTTSGRDLSSFPELSLYSDNDRWLICSESRPRLMRWCRFDPRSKRHSAGA